MDRSVKAVVLRRPDSANRPSAGSHHTNGRFAFTKRPGVRSTSRHSYGMPAISGVPRRLRLLLSPVARKVAVAGAVLSQASGTAKQCVIV
jgi:hypothetical protein